MKTVSSIMKDFHKAVTSLEKLSVKRTRKITKNNKKIKELKQVNFNHQAEISLADRTATSLKRLIGM